MQLNTVVAYEYGFSFRIFQRAYNMQVTYETNGKGLPEYPTDLPVKDVAVYRHDSGMMATHDYSCPCCRKKHAILDLSTGLMHPCWGCRKTYELVKIDRRTLWQKLLRKPLDAGGAGRR